MPPNWQAATARKKPRSCLSRAHPGPVQRLPLGAALILRRRRAARFILIAAFADLFARPAFIQTLLILAGGIAALLIVTVFQMARIGLEWLENAAAAGGRLAFADRIAMLRHRALTADPVAAAR